MPRKYTPRVPVTCEQCGETRLFPPFKAQYGNRGEPRRFCSAACYRVVKWPLLFTEDRTIAIITLYARDDSIRAYAMIDAEDAEWAHQWTWSLAEGYVTRRAPKDEGEEGGTRNRLLHREILGYPPGHDPEIDHIDRNRLNCRKGNLRPVPRGTNAQNRGSRAGSSSKYRGVSWDKSMKKWSARVCLRGKQRTLGYFTDEAEAAAVAKAARLATLPYAVD
jgi:hypothetical protein